MSFTSRKNPGSLTHNCEMVRKDEVLQQKIAEMERRKNDPMLHYEGEKDVEDIFDSPVESEQTAAKKHVKKKIKR